MADLTQLGGAMTALITPFKNGEVDHEALAALVERQIKGGIDGLVPCGTTGESATMTPKEQLEVISTVVEAAAGRVPIVAGAARESASAARACEEEEEPPAPAAGTHLPLSTNGRR